MITTLKRFNEAVSLHRSGWYHGTPNKHFSRFKLDVERSTDTYGGLEDTGLGVFLTDKKVMAGFFAGVVTYDVNIDSYVKTGILGNIAEVEVDCKKSFIAGIGEDALDDYMDEIESGGGVEGFRKWLLDNGYDSVLILNCDRQYYADDETYDVLVVLNPDDARIKRWIGEDEYLD